MKILIAEDDPTIRSNLSRTLRLEGYEPIAAENGQLALELLRLHQPALILSDVMMPELDGHGLLARVRAEPRWAGIPFVFLTARADRSDVREGMNLGADDYLTKPFQREELLGLVKTQLARSAQRNEATQRLQREASRLRSFDTLTDLPNRASLLLQMERHVQDARRGGTGLALASIGFSGLGDYRNVHGQAALDRVVRALADGLSAVAGGLPQPGLLARTGDERFALLLADSATEAELETWLREVGGSAARLQIEGERLQFPAFIGIARYPDNAEDAEGLMRCAESAESAPNADVAVAFFSPEANARISRRMQLLQGLHHALERDELRLAFQPQVATRDERVVGFEALLRWQHPQFGWVSPAEFIPIAEDSGLIVPIGAWVLEQAAAQAKDWLNAGFGPLRVAVNLSSRQFAEDDLPSRVAAVLQASGLPPAALELEITESIAMQSAERTLATLRTLKGLGVHLAMDDFGTGYSSLAYLKRYPLDVLKIDQVFIRNLTTDRGDAAITEAVVAMARSLGMQTVAEGVETQAHVDVLARLGCDICQGYHFAKPLSADAATDWLMERRDAEAAAR